MAEDTTTARIDPHLVAQIVGSYVRHHKVAVDQVGDLISGVHQSLAGLGRRAAPAPEEAARVPAVPIRRSVQRDYVVCLECGFRGLMLRHHLMATHGLDPHAYRACWKLAADHPLVAPSYSERRSALAKQLGLGRPAAAASDARAPASENGSPDGTAEPEPVLAAATAATAAPSTLQPPRQQSRRRSRPQRDQAERP